MDEYWQQPHHYEGVQEYVNRTFTQDRMQQKNEHHESDDFGTGGSAQRGQITLLEKLLKTANVWFLPHLSRSSVTHLLGPLSSGVFF
jgi:hypothetical protein